LGLVAGRVMSGRQRWAVRGGCELLPRLPWPGCRQVQGEASGRAGEPTRDGDELRADRARGGLGVEGRGQGVGGAGEVKRDRGADQTGAIGPTCPERQVRERSVLQVGDDLLDDRVRARWAFSASSIGNGLLLNTAWCRYAVNSSLWCCGFMSFTRRTISRAVTCLTLGREV